MFSFGTSSSAKRANGTALHSIVLTSKDKDRLSDLLRAYKLDDSKLVRFGSSDASQVIRDSSPCVVPFGSVFEAFGPLLTRDAGSAVYTKAAVRLVEVASIQVDFSASDGGFFGSLFGPTDLTSPRRSLRATLELCSLQTALVHGLLSDQTTQLPDKVQSNLIGVLSMADRLAADRVSLNF